MLNSLAELIMLSLIIDWIFRKIKIPGLVGMLLLGILFGPFVLHQIDPKLLDISGDLRLAALIVILLRAGFELEKNTLKKVGRQALLLSFVPATIEALTVGYLSHIWLGIGWMEGMILGCILGAVSPAVVVPLMIRFQERRMGTKKGIPTLLLAASSIDDVFVIVIYSILIGIYTGSEVNVAWELAGIPISIISGIAAGLLAGLVLYKLFDHFNPRATKRALVVMAVAVLFIRLEHLSAEYVPFAGLLAVMAIGVIILEKRASHARELSAIFAKAWIPAEIILFTLVGAQVNIDVAWASGLAGAAVIFGGLIMRSAGTWLCLYGTELTKAERLFVVIAYIPKATVQAAIGAAPLAAMAAAGMDTGPGDLILAMAVLSILLTAPLGAWAIIFSGERILSHDGPAENKKEA